MMRNYSQRVSCDMPGICLMLFCLHIATLPSLWWIHLQLHPFTPGIFAKKCFMKQVKPFSSHCLTTEEPEQLKTLFIGQALQNQMQNTDIYVHQLPNFKHAQKAKFQDSFWVLKWHNSPDFHLSLSHLLSSSALFLAPFFPFCWAFTTLYFSGKVFGKAFRIVGLDARKCRCEQHHCNLREKAPFFFSNLLDWIKLILVWNFSFPWTT